MPTTGVRGSNIIPTAVNRSVMVNKAQEGLSADSNPDDGDGTSIARRRAIQATDRFGRELPEPVSAANSRTLTVSKPPVAVPTPPAATSAPVVATPAPVETKPRAVAATPTPVATTPAPAPLVPAVAPTVLPVGTINPVTGKTETLNVASTLKSPEIKTTGEAALTTPVSGIDLLTKTTPGLFPEAINVSSLVPANFVNSQSVFNSSLPVLSSSARNPNSSSNSIGQFGIPNTQLVSNSEQFGQFSNGTTGSNLPQVTQSPNLSGFTGSPANNSAPLFPTKTTSQELVRSMMAQSNPNFTPTFNGQFGFPSNQFGSNLGQVGPFLNNGVPSNPNPVTQIPGNLSTSTNPAANPTASIFPNKSSSQELVRAMMARSNPNSLLGLNSQDSSRFSGLLFQGQPSSISNNLAAFGIPTTEQTKRALAQAEQLFPIGLQLGAQIPPSILPSFPQQ